MLCFICRKGVTIQVHRGKRVYFKCLLCHKLSERYYELFGKTKVKKTFRGPMHFSAGALIEKKGKYLVSKRTFYPYMYTLIGGHVDKGETMEAALKREVKEETGLKILDKKLIFRGIIGIDSCTKGVNIHYWNLFLIHATGKLKTNYHESVHLRWLTKKQMKHLHFIPPLTFIFEKLSFFKNV